jgi:hypothetical protein
MSDKAFGAAMAIIAVMVAAWVASVSIDEARDDIAKMCENYRSFTHEGKRYTCEVAQ